MIIIPMAGRGKRFIDAGYKEPKPLIKVNGRPMIDWVLKGLPKQPIIFLVLKEHLKDLRPYLRNKGRIIVVEKMTEGAVCTVLLAEKYIDKSELVILNCDQIIELNYKKFLRYARTLDGCIVTFRSRKPNHSYAKVGKDKRVIEVAEKVVISNHATAGLYYFKRGIDFLWAADLMIKNNIRVNNEFYLCPTYNLLISLGSSIGIWELDNKHCFMLGTPEELKEYEKSFVFRGWK